MVDYAMRYKEYSEQLCENRNNPDSQCKGSCQISRILQGEDPAQKPALPGFNIPSDWLASFVSIEIPEWTSHFKTKPLADINLYRAPTLSTAGKPPQG